ncbi:MAG: ankyrin repeat domain-containing protein [Bacteroidetes bacterium]|nr:ankyrin repeat domain-containing protein [Bacteroidota bacterium]
MKNPDIQDPLFRRAVEAIDSGDLGLLQELVGKHPSLVTARLDSPTGDYFDSPYLLWFVADNPIRSGELPHNIVEITAMLADSVKRYAPETAQQQLDYALGLVATGRTPHESGRQLGMMDALIDAGAKPGTGNSALAHGNIDAAKHLIERGGMLSLPVAVALEQMDDVQRLLPLAAPAEKLTALTVAAFYGKPDMVFRLLEAGADTNGYPDKNSGFHSHATPLHQAVSSGSLSCVKLLAEHDAGTGTKDTIYGGTALDWAEHLQRETADESLKNKYQAIAEYLRGLTVNA